MIITELETLLSTATDFKEKRNYWLVRTQGGLYYEHFKAGNFIAIGFNEINLVDIYESKKDEKEPLKLLTETIKNRRPEDTKPRYAANQLLKFSYEIKKGDIIIIPSESSFKVSIGEVQSSLVEIVENPKRPINLSQDEETCPFQKQKKVRWFKEIKRTKLPPSLFKLLFSHHIITEATDYANSVDTLLSDFYVKGDNVVLVLEVATQDDINARTLFGMGCELLDLVDDFCNYYNLGINTDDVEVKIGLQSQGKIQLSTKTKSVGLITGLLVIGIVGGGFKVQTESFTLDLSTQGLIQKVEEYLDHKHQREVKQQLLDKHMKSLQIQKPEDLIRVIEATTTIGNQLPKQNVNNSDSTSTQ